MTTTPAPKALPLNPRHPRKRSATPAEAVIDESPAKSEGNPYTPYEWHSFTMLSKIDSRLNSIRLLLWWIGVWLPLIATALYLVSVAATPHVYF